MCTTQILDRAFRAIGDRLGDGPHAVFACPLNPHFAQSATHCVGVIMGINLNLLDPCSKPADYERVALICTPKPDR